MKKTFTQDICPSLQYFIVVVAVRAAIVLHSVCAVDECPVRSRFFEMGNSTNHLDV